MRHRNRNMKLGRDGAHQRCLLANLLKSLVSHERIETTVSKAKVLKSSADKLITLAKEQTLASRRRAIAKLMVRFNALTPKEARAAKAGDTSAFNDDRLVITKLFGDLATRFAERQGGYTRIIRTGFRRGDDAETCVIEYLSA